MSQYPSDIGFSPAVKAIQVEKGSRDSYAKMEQKGGWKTTVTPELEAFISQLDMFYRRTTTTASSGTRRTTCDISAGRYDLTANKSDSIQRSEQTLP